MKNVAQTIQSQYQSSPTLTGLIDFWNESVSIDADLRNYYNTVWNVITASGYGLDVWGRIVGVSRYLTVSTGYSYFGFQEATGSQPFGQAPLYLGQGLSGTSQITLADTAFRQLILLKAQANISDCSAASLNRLLTQLYADRGQCYVIDTGGMSFVYRFKFNLTPTDFTILAQSGILPRPAGVSYSIIQGP